MSNYSIHELPGFTSDEKQASTPLAARVELLKAETKHLKTCMENQKKPEVFQIGKK